MNEQHKILVLPGINGRFLHTGTNVPDQTGTFVPDYKIFYLSF